MNNYVKDEELFLRYRQCQAYHTCNTATWSGSNDLEQEVNGAKSEFLSKDEFQNVNYSDKTNSQYVDQHTLHECAVGLCPWWPEQILRWLSWDSCRKINRRKVDEYTHKMHHVGLGRSPCLLDDIPYWSTED
jgi:hypothetical protein